MTAQRAPVRGSPGQRWHFSHGPIDLVIGAEGEGDSVAASHAAAWRRFEGVLDELVGELPQLRTPIPMAVDAVCSLQGPIARRMWQACWPFRAGFITPMAAVAGAVAQELIACYRRDGITRAWVNNGGDIALHLSPGASVRVGLFADLARVRQAIDARFEIHADLPVRGIATSGWRGRSQSLGIADSVTVLAATAAEADAAATVIANAVDIDDARVLRRPACEVKDDSDLGTLPVTVYVPALDAASVQCALARGLARAHELRSMGAIWHAVLVCQRQVVDTLPAAVEAARLDAVVGSVFA